MQEALDIIHNARALIRKAMAGDLPESEALAFLAKSEEYFAEVVGEKPRYD